MPPAITASSSAARRRRPCRSTPTASGGQLAIAGPGRAWWSSSASCRRAVSPSARSVGRAVSPGAGSAISEPVAPAAA
eukprot:5058748-Pleurochrysis_carterae.AAC.1